MAKQAAMIPGESKFARANGTDIHYVEAGKGEPLLLLHGGMMSTSAVWADFIGGYVSHMATLVQHFRVIAPDTRGHGRTANPAGGSISFEQLADDVLALIDALALRRPLICGFSDGGTIATIVAMRRPDSIRALVNDAGFDGFDPKAPSFGMLRQMLGGSPEATAVDPEVAERSFAANGMQGFLDRMKADHDEAPGSNTWKTMLSGGFDRWTRTPIQTFDDFRKIEAPTLILTGDRDFCCSVEMAIAAYRLLPRGELAILPGHNHGIPASAVQASIEFLHKWEA